MELHQACLLSVRACVRALTVHPPVAVAQAGAAVVRHRTVGQVAVAVVGRGARDH